MENKELDYTVIKRLFPYLKGYKRNLIVFVFLSLIKVLMSVFTPYLLAYLLDHLFSFNTNTFVFFLFLLGSSYLFSIVINRILANGMLTISESVLFKLRNDLFSSIQKKGITEVSSYQKGDLIARFTSTLEQIGESLGEVFLELMSNLFLLFGSAFLMFHMHVKLSLLILLTVPLFFVGAVFIALKCGKYETKKQEKIGEITGYFEEKLTGLPLIKAYQVEENCINEFETINEELYNLQTKNSFFTNLIFPLNTLISNLGNIAIFFYGAYLVLQGEITVGVLFAFLSYADMFRSPIHEIGSIFSDFSSGIAGLHRIFEVIDEEIPLDGVEELQDFDCISFQNVFFKYDKEEVLKEITFKVPKGEKVAIVGPTGSGKTTLVQLLLASRKPTKGSIFIGRTKLEDLEKKSLYRHISVLFQEPFLFNMSILENVLYGNKGCRKKDAIEALKTVGADFVWKFENKEQQIVGKNGKNLSEGERQLIVIARAMLKNAEILILDEATSHVDLFTEKKVQDAMLALMKNKTVIIIAHRLKTIIHANQILYLEKGRIKEIGTHKSLLLKKGKYYSLYKSQIS